MRAGIAIGFILAVQSLFAQTRLAVIKDTDGFVNVRQGKGMDSAVADSIKADEIFYCFPDQSDWIKVHRRGTVATGEFDGYIHKSRIEFFDNLPDERKGLLFQKTFSARKELAQRATDAFQRNESISKEDQKEFDKGILSNYALLVDKFPPYFCKTKDMETVRIFLETLYADSNSANEAPLFDIGACFICEPNLVLEVIGKNKSNKKREHLYHSIEWGIVNLLKDKDPKFVKLKKQLDLALSNNH